MLYHIHVNVFMFLINMLPFFQLEIDKLKLQAEDIVTENQQLQEKFERIQTENPVDMNDW